MRTLRLLLLLTVAAVSYAPGVPAFEIPEFTSNVIDPAGHLDASQRTAVLAALESMRDAHPMQGAVLIVDTLGEAPIENVAVEAFSKWQLGKAHVDNGLLLVLAIQDRKSRLEVGYGLEGVITDAVASRALREHLAPRMREGDIARGIIDTFVFLRAVASRQRGALPAAENPYEMDDLSWWSWPRALGGWTWLIFAVWAWKPLRDRRAARLRLRWLAADATLSREEVPPPAERRWDRWGSQIALSLVPGVFVAIASGVHWVPMLVCGVTTLIVMSYKIRRGTAAFSSLQRYRELLEGLAQERAAQVRSRAELVARGEMIEVSPGVFEYTAAFHARLAAENAALESWARQFSSATQRTRSPSVSKSGRSSSSTKPSSSRSRSSSGGGKSGGGGASSNW